MKTAHELQQEYRIKSSMTYKDVCELMHEYARQALIEFRKECAEKTKLSVWKQDGSNESYCNSQVMFNGVEAQVFIDKDSILNIDIEKYIQ